MSVFEHSVEHELIPNHCELSVFLKGNLLQEVPLLNECIKFGSVYFESVVLSLQIKRDYSSKWLVLPFSSLNRPTPLHLHRAPGRKKKSFTTACLS